MKLSDKEIYAIEKYLLEQDLISLEFYEEMLDHFTSSIEVYKAAGDSFESAFKQTKNGFLTIRYTKGFRYPKYYGIKALEQERAEEFKESFKAVKEWSPLNLFRSKLWFVWLLVSILYFILSIVFGLFFIQLVSTATVLVLAALIIYYSLESSVIFNGSLFGRWSRFFFSSLNKRKNIQLQPNFRLYVLVNSFRTTLFVFPLIMVLLLRDKGISQIELGLNFPTITSIVMLGYLLIIIDHFIQFKKEYNKTMLQKA